ncbi:hypothetical protein ACFVAF_39630, partial [Streptomyces sp. NPDC057596]|uniref:hypothetical protein n=1 Tax=Streptomyces sp. NPDC057596 TaxID=3346178 RepID=UPI003690F638
RVVLHRHRRSSRFLRIKQIQYQRVHHSGGGPVQAATALDLTIPSDVQVAQDIDDASTHTVAPSITALDQHADAQAQAAWAASADLVELGVVRGIVEPTG